MRVFVVTIPFTVQRRVFSSIHARTFEVGDEIHIFPASNLSDSEGLYWLDFHQSEKTGDCVYFDDDYGHLLDTNDLEAHCMEM